MSTHLPFAALFFFFGIPYISVFDRTGLEKSEFLMDEMCSLGLCVRDISQTCVVIVGIYCYI